MVIALPPTFRLIALLALPEATGTPLTLAAAAAWLRIGVSAIAAVAFGTATV